MPALYTEIQFGALKSQLALALGDAGKVFFQDEELARYLYEALTVYQSFSNYWKETALYSPVAGARWNVLSDPATGLVNSLGENALQNQLTDRDLLCYVFEALIEDVPADFTTSWGLTEQFTEDEIIAALNRVYHKFFIDSGALVRTISQVLSPNQEYYDLPERVVDVMGVAYIPVASTSRYPLYKTGRGDYDAIQGYGELTSGVPASWSLDSDTMRLRIFPPPIDTGSLEILVYKIPATDLSPKSSATNLEIPPNLWWILKYGILADLLRHDGQSPDWARAEYCQQRWDDGMKLISLAIPTIINARINNRQVPQTDVIEEDSYQAGWAQETGIGNRVINASWDFVSICPVRAIGADPTSVELLLSQRVRLPENDTSIVQLPKEAVNPILEYAKHIAMLKISGAEFAQTLNAYKILFETAMQYNQILAANSRTFSFNAKKAEGARDKEFRNRELEG